MTDALGGIMMLRKSRPLCGLLLGGALLALPAIASAQLTESRQNMKSEAVVIDQPAPGYPGHMVRKGQEGWVRMHFVVTADGKATDPIFVDTSGGAGFEQEARGIIGKWRFEKSPTGAELPHNVINIRTEIRLGREAATSNFLKRYRRIVTHLIHEEFEYARKQVDDSLRRGGWNLYESAMLWLMVGRVEGGEGDDAGKLEAYRRALAIATRKAIDGKDRRDLIAKIFGLQDQFGHFADALRTYALLEREAGGSKGIEAATKRAEEIAVLLDSAPTITANATIYNPCDCDQGTPLWYYRPARRTFSFANLDGNVERFEARCETGRTGDNIEEGITWTLAPDWGRCHVFVFGDDGARFDFIEHLEGGPDGDPDEATLARNHVLD